ncbi:acyl-coenzyme A thioesterase PaaI-like protein [Desulfohalotomaculum tongense]|uniref:transcription factor FapR n=1 Tax=Desulforadius tongensis TaxID=1216062 RepID=UPI00195A0ABA|nr:transcription factor FapR [Desulforadius tongensis]MBM7854401.1 acyl-coenzyme A thioesterase PaaI-like protein [Desulforadius tongensis]
MARKSTAKLQRHQKLTTYIKTNPFLTDEELAELLGVSVQTIRLDRLELRIPEYRERLKHVAKGETLVKSLSHGELVGELVDIEVGKAGSSILTITKDMVFKKNLLARGHHLFAQANSLAVAIIDAVVALTGNAKVSFRQPVKRGDRVLARASITGSRENRYKVAVISKVKDKVVFEGQFTVFAMEEEV